MLRVASVQRAWRFSSHFGLTRCPADATLCVNAVRPDIQKCFRAARNSCLIYHRERVDLNLQSTCRSYDTTTKHRETKLYFWQCSLLFPLCYIWSQLQNGMNNLVKRALLLNWERSGPALQKLKTTLYHIFHIQEALTCMQVQKACFTTNKAAHRIFVCYCDMPYYWFCWHDGRGLSLEHTLWSPCLTRATHHYESQTAKLIFFYMPSLSAVIKCLDEMPSTFIYYVCACGLMS